MSDLTSKPLTQAQLADLMRPGLEALPLDNEWKEVAITIKRNDDQSLALHSIVIQPAFERDAEPPDDRHHLVALLVEAEGLLCDPQGGWTANELAGRIRARLSPTKPEIPARDELNGESPRAGASVGQPSRAGTPREKYIGCDGCGMGATGRCPHCQALSCDSCSTCEHKPSDPPEWRLAVETEATHVCGPGYCLHCHKPG